MSQQRETATDRLVSIIQVIQLGRKTGLLTAKRGEGITREEGTITFIKGKITQTTAGRRKGSEALNWLTTWGNCRFTFVSSDLSETSPSLTPIPPNASAPGMNGTDPDLRQQRSLQKRQTEPLLAGESNGVAPQRPNKAVPATTSSIPFRMRQIDSALRVIENMGLSRTHRHLLLLIDGQRSIPELVRLIGRSEHEVASLLYDLEQATVIQIPGTSPFRR